jgi:DNA polymerase-3 subunit delta'
MLFREIPGLSSIKKTLIHSVQSNHVAHAQLFHGPVGSGNLALAWAYATYINCEDKQPDDACGRCASCVKMRKLIHPDFYHIFPTATTKKVKEAESDAYMPLWREFTAEQPYGVLPNWLEHIGVEGNKQGNISAEEARKIIQKLSLKAFEAEYKILLIWQPEMLNQSSANALLKILEEPPAKTLFLLVCNDVNKLLITILSRTQRVSVPQFSDEDITSYLAEKAHIESARAKQIAYLSEGNLNKALALSKNQGQGKHQWFANWMRMAYKPDVAALVKLADEFDAFSKEDQKGMMEYGLNIFRDLLMWKSGAESLVRLEGDELTFVQNFSKAVNLRALELISGEFSQTHYYLERNARAKILHLDLSLQIAKLFKQK